MKKKLLIITICSFVLFTFSFFKYLQAGYIVEVGKGVKITKVKVSPPTAKVKVGKTSKFTAQVIGKGKFDKSVLWSVEGGDANGTITATDKKHATYKAPDSVPEGEKVTIKATSNADSNKSGTATITITSGSSTSTSVTTTSTTTTTFFPVTPGNTIKITGFSFDPVNIGVAPGTTITVFNLDGSPHSVTSQAKEGNFTFGKVNDIGFDTGEFTTPNKSFIIPPNAVPGTVIPYYCTVHKGLMKTKNGYVTVQ